MFLPRIAIKGGFGSSLPAFSKIRYYSTEPALAQASSSSSATPHIPVMLNQVLEHLKPKPNQTILDMTFGAGGHSKALLESAPGIKILALDRDPTANNFAKKLQDSYPGQVTPLLGRFSELPALLKAHQVDFDSLDGILFDYGCSSMQFDEAERGFALSKDGPLDMRMDKDRFPDQPTAAQILSKIDEDDLARILKIYGEEKNAKKIARAIVEARYLFKRLETTKELADVVNAACEEEHRLDKLHRPTNVATKTFQALRIFINNELNEINFGMILAQKYLRVGGRLVTITFHSLEDTIVKRHMMGHVSGNAANTVPLRYMNPALVSIHQEDVQQVMASSWLPLTKHVLVPTEKEIDQNPRSRSAKLRAAVRVQ